MSILQLLDSTRDRVRTGWAAKLNVDSSVLVKPGITILTSETAQGVLVLRLEQSWLVRRPESVEAALAALSQNELIDMASLLRILEAYKPEPVGIASIAYADLNTLRQAPSTYQVRAATALDLNEVMSGCTDEENEESGLVTMPFLFSAHTTDGSVGAIAGYESWNDDLAQLGVLAIPSQRGNGLAFAAAYATTRAALDVDLIPQWRSRIGNEASSRMGERLGFQELGRQLFINL